MGEMGSEFQRILEHEPTLGDYGFCQWEGGDLSVPCCGQLQSDAHQAHDARIPTHGDQAHGYPAGVGG